MINTNKILITNLWMDKLQHKTDLEVEFSVLSGLNLNKMNFHHSRQESLHFTNQKMNATYLGLELWPRSWGKTY